MQIKDIENKEIRISKENRDESVTKRYVGIKSAKGKKLIEDHKTELLRPNDPNQN